MRRFQIVAAIWLAGIFITLSTAHGDALSGRGSDAIGQAAESTLREIREQENSLNNERFERLINETKSYLGEQKFDKAVVTAEAALQIQPGDATAVFLRDKAIRLSGTSRDRLLRDLRRVESAEALGSIDEAMTIPANVVTYPESRNWSEIRRNSTGRGVTGPIVTAWEENLRKQLQQRVSFSFDNQSLEEILKSLSDTTGVGIRIDPRAPIGNDSLTLELNNVRLESALHQICRLAEVKWSMADTMIYVSDTTILDDAVVITYDISDLLMPIRDFRSGNRAPAAGRVPDRGFNTMKGIEVSVTYDERFQDNASQEIRGNELVYFLKRAVAPETWAQPGERDRGRNSVQYRQGRLVVSAPPDIQRQVERLLENFRKARTVQVMVSTRFIDIEQSYLEEIGVDWTGLEGGANQIYPDSPFTPRLDDGTPLPIQRGFSARGRSALDEFGNPRYFGYAQTPGVNAYAGLPDGSFATGEWGRYPEPMGMPRQTRPGGKWDVGMANINLLGVPLGDPSFNRDGGLFLDVALLGRYQLRMLLEAVVKHRKGNILTSPRLTCFNGQRANIALTTQINYVQNVSGTTPEIGVLTDGIVFEVVPYVSADRRYVTMELRPTLQNVLSIQTVTVTVPDMVGEEITRVTTQIGLPRILVKSVETFASVPDGGTLLLGGLTQVTETEVRAGVPILNRIPVVRFFFSRWGKSDMRNSLIILVRADVLIQGEHEPQVGPAR